MVIRGEAPPVESRDLFYNYQHYANRTINAHPGKEIMVVRTGHMWEDLSIIERRLGGDTIMEFYDGDEAHENFTFPNITSISTESQHILCCAIQEEVGIYVDLITRATNLDASSRQETFESLWKKCGANSMTKLASACTLTMTNPTTSI
jgi:hypothetical protein